MIRSTLAVVVSSSIVIVACSSNNTSTGPTTNTGTACTSAASCYPNIDAGALMGQVQCLTNLQNGYCTHTCTKDSDCCAVAGECPGGFAEVCAPLQSAPQTYCFLSCDAGAVGGMDPTAYCQQHANAAFTCRSTGGGSNNRKFCGP